MKSVLPAGWKVPAQLEARLGDSIGRQRAMTADGHLLLLLHEPPEPNQRTRKARLFWRDLAGNWSSNAKGTGVGAIKKHLADFSARADALELQLQNADGAEDYFRLLQQVAPLYRTTRNLHATLQQAREMVPNDRDLIVARDSAGDIERSFELLHHDARNGLDYTVAIETETQSQRTYEMAVSAHRLNLLAAIFFPIATMSAIFGMRLQHGLDRWQAPWLFWGVLGGGFVSGLILALLIARKPKASISNSPLGEWCGER